MGRQIKTSQVVWFLLILFTFTGGAYAPSFSFYKDFISRLNFSPQPIQVIEQPEIVVAEKPSLLSQALQEKFQISRLTSASA